jgi:HSP20 family molecular chaperone IbpA
MVFRRTVWSSVSPWKNVDTFQQRPAQLIDNDKVWKLSYDLPGIKAKDLSVTVDGSNVQVTASRNFASLSGDSKTVKKSRIFKSFPVNSLAVDLSQLKANLSDGVLVISAPKNQASNVKEISITIEPHKEEDLALLEGDLEDLDEDEVDDVMVEQLTLDDKDGSGDSKAKK